MSRIVDSQRVLPFQIEGYLIDRFLVGQIVYLLQKHDPQHGVEVLGRGPRYAGVVGGELVDGKNRQDLLPEELGPGFLQPAPPVRAETRQRVEHVAGFVVLGEEHGASGTC
jgi:hypothetical protein